MPSKYYRLQSEPGHFYTGCLEDGTQVLMGIDYPNLIAVLFDPEGTFLKSLVREISKESQIAIQNEINAQRGNSSWRSWDEDVFNKDWDELDRWAEELGFVKGVISVQKFSLPELELGIQDLPGIYQEMLDSGSGMDEEAQKEIQDWQEGSDYVLVWGQEYYVNQEGEVVFT